MLYGPAKWPVFSSTTATDWSLRGWANTMLEVAAVLSPARVPVSVDCRVNQATLSTKWILTNCNDLPIVTHLVNSSSHLTSATKSWDNSYTYIMHACMNVWYLWWGSTAAKKACLGFPGDTHQNTPIWLVRVIELVVTAVHTNKYHHPYKSHSAMKPAKVIRDCY